ncbi:hypothetical protein Avbf_18889 [Armadillidium vulgare]|nr:hypothetical protein Avbf_18889 [Armadillidium vulgare]
MEMILCPNIVLDRRVRKYNYGQTCILLFWIVSGQYWISSIYAYSISLLRVLCCETLDILSVNRYQLT